MKYSIAAVAALFATNAFAHPGHTEMVAGHTHTLLDLAVMGLVPVAAGLLLLGLAFATSRHKND